jgi:hypothetical protein
MACKPCAQRRKEWKARQEAKKAKGKTVQAAAIGAALAVTEAVGTAIGINSEVEYGQPEVSGSGDSSGYVKAGADEGSGDQSHLG